MNLPQQICTAVEDAMYCFAVLGDVNEGTFDTDLCGQFPVHLLKGMQYICVVYVYKINSILMPTVKGHMAGHVVEVFTNVYILFCVNPI